MLFCFIWGLLFNLVVDAGLKRCMMLSVTWNKQIVRTLGLLMQLFLLMLHMTFNNSLKYKISMRLFTCKIIVFLLYIFNIYFFCFDIPILVYTLHTNVVFSPRKFIFTSMEEPVAYPFNSNPRKIHSYSSTTIK